MAKRKPKQKKGADAEQAQSFESALTDLQQVVEDLETGRLGLEESLSRFEHGTALLRSCYARLNQAEQRVEILTASDGDELTTAPLDATSTAHTSSVNPGTRGSSQTASADSDDSQDEEKSLF
jgi:exodeoxyribonuclease VII small subunit